MDEIENIRGFDSSICDNHHSLTLPCLDSPIPVLSGSVTQSPEVSPVSTLPHLNDQATPVPELPNQMEPPDVLQPSYTATPPVDNHIADLTESAYPSEEYDKDMVLLRDSADDSQSDVSDVDAESAKGDEDGLCINDDESQSVVSDVDAESA